MARHPEWFARLDAILAVLEQSPPGEWLGRPEIESLFGVSARDSIRLLHRFGATERNDALALLCSALLPQLEAVREGDPYAAFGRRRDGVAQQLAQARTETAARQFRVRPVPVAPDRPRFRHLPSSVTWRRTDSPGPGRFEILYDDGADLLWQLAEFLETAGANRTEFVAGTEPAPADQPPPKEAA